MVREERGREGGRVAIMGRKSVGGGRNWVKLGYGNGGKYVVLMSLYAEVGGRGARGLRGAQGRGLVRGPCPYLL